MSRKHGPVFFHYTSSDFLLNQPTLWADKNAIRCINQFDLPKLKNKYHAHLVMGRECDETFRPCMDTGNVEIADVLDVVVTSATRTANVRLLLKYKGIRNIAEADSSVVIIEQTTAQHFQSVCRQTRGFRDKPVCIINPR